MTEITKQTAHLLMAEDDPADILLTRKALEASRFLNDMHVVGDGQELLDYLRSEGGYADTPPPVRPDIILLDLNMPGMDGREALVEIRKDEDLRRIPVVILTTSDADEDIVRTYDLGANSYIRKPVGLDGLIQAIRDLEHYWFELVKLPPR